MQGADARQRVWRQHRRQSGLDGIDLLLGAAASGLDRVGPKRRDRPPKERERTGGAGDLTEGVGLWAAAGAAKATAAARARARNIASAMPTNSGRLGAPCGSR